MSDEHVRVNTEVPPLLHALNLLGYDVLTRDAEGHVVVPVREHGTHVVARAKVRDPGERSVFVGRTVAQVFKRVLPHVPTSRVAEVRVRLMEERAALAEWSGLSGDVGFRLAMEERKRALAPCLVVIPGIGQCELPPDGHSLHRHGAVAWNGPGPDA